MNYAVALENEVDVDGLDEDALSRLAAHALAVEHVPAPAELSIVLSDDATVQQLNLQYRGTDAPTDVLSFSQAEGEAFAVPDGETPHLGDVIISIDTARAQAVDYGLSLQDEVAHLLVHGILHLLGYDHIDADDERLMRAHEDAVLGSRAHHH
jgi:probable rRNA maturation factor